MKLSVAFFALFAQSAAANDFAAFKERFNKVYTSVEEELKRAEIFAENLLIIAERNAAEIAAGGEAVHGITKFADMHQDEFVSLFNGSGPNVKEPENVLTGLPKVNSTDLVDWTGVYTTPVKNQEQCGSCWAFSATEQFESDVMRVLSTTYELSPQQIVSCDTRSAGCRGGNTETAYAYIKKFGGQEEESAYPYTSHAGVSHRCEDDVSKVVATQDGFTTVRGEDNMASYVTSTGPLSICVDASTWNSYTGGVMKVCGKQIDHCVQAVGVLPDETTGYWKVRNSWATDWGEDGFIRLAFGKDTCGLTNDPTYLKNPTLV